ncbi:hypothetical protein [Couchioplanes caeruleus]|nr:hypothetical protein [Couchioplanes caeruleus]
MAGPQLPVKASLDVDFARVASVARQYRQVCRGFGLFAAHQ